MEEYWWHDLINSTLDTNYTFDEDLEPLGIQPVQVVILVCYALVFVLGVPGNCIVVWVTGFQMNRSVTSLWFLNLALADLLCCLSLPLLMVPVAYDDEWHFGSLACTLVKGLFYLVMYCSIIQLVFISLDRWLLVCKPVWCQNYRRPRRTVWVCVGIWLLALLGSIPQFKYAKELPFGDDKMECKMAYPYGHSWLLMSLRFLLGFFLPFVVIVVCHLVVYSRAQGGQSSGARGGKGRRGPRRTVRVIIAVMLSFFLCWIPLHILDFLELLIPLSSPHSPKIYHAQNMALCLAYFNSCLNPLLYVCMGRSFKDSMHRSLRGLFHFISEEPTARNAITNTDTKSTSTGREMTRI